MQIGGSTVAGAITEATGVSRAKLHTLYNKLGDLGDVAQACRHNQARPALRCAEWMQASIPRPKPWLWMEHQTPQQSCLASWAVQDVRCLNQCQGLCWTCKAAGPHWCLWCFGVFVGETA